MPEDIDAKVGDKIAGARLLPTAERHGISGKRFATKPEKVSHHLLQFLKLMR